MAISSPTSQEVNLVQRTIADQKRIYQEYVTVTRQMRRQRALRLDTRTPRSFQRLIGKGVRAPLSWSVVQTINGLMAKSPPYFSRIPLSTAKKEDANKLAATCWPLLQTFSRMAHRNLYYLIIDQLSGDGKSVVKFQRKALADYPDQADFTDENGKFNASAYNEAVKVYLSQDGHNPFRLALVDPVVFWPDRSDEPEYVVESGNRALVPTLKALNLRLGVNNAIMEAPETKAAGYTFSEEMIPTGLSPYEKVDELWTEDACYLQLAGQIIKLPNELGFIPYAWRGGMETSIPDPVMENVSTVFPFYGLEPELNTLLTSIVAWSVLAGMPVAIIETPASTGVPQGQETPPTDIPMGQMMQLAAGKKFSFASPPPVGDTVVQAANLILSFYERAGVTTAARGMIGTRTPGLTFTSALEAAADMLVPIKTGAEGIMEDIIRMTWKAVVKLNLPIYVTGEDVVEATGRKQYSNYQITPRLIGNYYDIHCEIRPSSTQDQIQKGMHAAFMNQHQLWSTERAMVYSGVDNPIAERIELLKDTIRHTPLYQRMAMMAALQNDPEGQQMVEEAKAQGVDLLGLEDFSGQAEPAGGGGGAPPEGLPGGQVRGLPAPSAGGRVAGAPRQPTGPRPVAQGGAFPK